MKQLNVPLINTDLAGLNLGGISDLLDLQQRHLITIAPWPAYTSKVQASFSIAQVSNHVLIKYFVREASIRAVNFSYNSPVYEDSCVELFISFDEDPNYYNIEMNCIGTLLMGYGSGRDNRLLIGENILKKISRQVSVTHDSDSNLIAWELTALLPLVVFNHRAISQLSGCRCRANFFKCGDRLPEPHFLCWSEVQAAEPDFHLPHFFGELYFE